MSAINPGDLIDGRYRIVSRVGAGGMADVFLAEDQQLGRQVALKLLHRRFSEEPGFVERFRREAQSAASLQHPNVVSVFDRGEFDGTYYIAMEYLQGRTLKVLIRQEAPLDPIRAIDLTLQILRATRFAHRRGVIHRDLKPHNVIVDENDHAKVTDFGIARAGASDMTETGSIMGTAQYLSPEQAQGHAVSETSDLYSIGVVLYEMLTARVPFDAESAVTIALKHVSEAPMPPTVITPSVPEPLEQVVLWALNKDPADRPADAEQFIAVLEQVREAIASGALGQMTANMPAVTAVAVTDRGGPRALPVPAPVPTAFDAYGDAVVVDDGAGRGDLARRNGSGEPPRTGSSPWPWIVGLLILLLAGGGVAAYLLTRPAKATVPDVVLYQETQAQTVIQNDGFAVSILPVTSSAPVNQVIGQYPLAFARVNSGSTVTLTVSNGPGDVNVPSVDGLSEGAALRQLRAAGLVVDSVISQSSSSVGVKGAIQTSPPAGTQLAKGTSVTLYVSTGKAPVDVPSVTGDTVAAAKSALASAGFTVTTTTQPSSTVAPGIVTAQTPNGGVSAAAGSSVALVVAAAPTTAAVPSVVGFTAPAADSALTSAGFKAARTQQNVTTQSQDGIVISQTPTSGATEKKGTTVTIVVGQYTATTTTTSGSTTTRKRKRRRGSSTTTSTSPGLTPTTTTTTTTTPTTPTTSTTPTTPTTSTTSTTPTTSTSTTSTTTTP